MATVFKVTRVFLNSIAHLSACMGLGDSLGTDRLIGTLLRLIDTTKLMIKSLRYLQLDILETINYNALDLLTLTVAMSLVCVCVCVCSMTE